VSGFPDVATRAARPSEGLCRPGGTAGVDGHLEVAVGPVLEADRHGQPGGKLAVDLAFGGPGPDGAPRDEVCHVLRADRLQEFGGGGQAQSGDLLQEVPCDAQAGDHVVAAVQAGIVDQALPAHRGAGLFEVRAHDHQEVFLVLLGLAHQPAGVFQPGLGIVDGAGADDDQEAVIHAVHDGADFVTAAFDDACRLFVQGQLCNEVLGRGKGGEFTDAQVRRGVLGCCGVHVVGPVPDGKRARNSEPAGETAKGRE
jgi:hypothetical protein